MVVGSSWPQRKEAAQKGEHLSLLFRSSHPRVWAKIYVHHLKAQLCQLRKRNIFSFPRVRVANEFREPEDKGVGGVRT